MQKPKRTEIYCPLCKQNHQKFKTKKRLTEEEKIFMACLLYHQEDNGGAEVLENEEEIANKLIKRNIIEKIDDKHFFLVKIKEGLKDE